MEEYVVREPELWVVPVVPVRQVLQNPHPAVVRRPPRPPKETVPLQNKTDTHAQNLEPTVPLRRTYNPFDSPIYNMRWPPQIPRSPRRGGPNRLGLRRPRPLKTGPWHIHHASHRTPTRPVTLGRPVLRRRPHHGPRTTTPTRTTPPKPGSHPPLSPANCAPRFPL